MLIYNDISPFKFGLNPGGEKKILTKNHQSIAADSYKEFQAVFHYFLQTILIVSSFKQCTQLAQGAIPRWFLVRDFFLSWDLNQT